MTPPPGPGWRGVARLLIVGVCVACKQASAEEGGVSIEWLEVAEGAYGLRGTVTVRARPEAIWGVLTDYGRFPEIYPDVARAEVKESGPGARTRPEGTMSTRADGLPGGRSRVPTGI